MRTFSLLLGLAALAPAAALAQVQIHPAALAQLAGISAAPALPPAPHRAVHRVVARAVRHRPRPAEQPVLPAPPPPAPGRTPAVTPAAARPVAAPPKPPAPPKPLAIRFAPGSSALPPQAQAALAPFCKTSVKLGIDARAPGDPSDPSVAMRLSLARALAVRDALTACGVNSVRIIPRALGAAPGGPDDAAMLAVEGKTQ